MQALPMRGSAEPSNSTPAGARRPRAVAIQLLLAGILVWSLLPTASVGATSRPARASAPVSTQPSQEGSLSPSDLATYLGEGLFLSHFEEGDIQIWQAYSQATETILAEGESPPEGYINVAEWHAKYVDRWVQPAPGFALSTEQVVAGSGAGHWGDTTTTTRLVAADIPHDWSGYQFLSFWLYSATDNGAAIELAIYSESDETAGDDYYKREILIDWSGWRLLEIPLYEFRATRSPEGWHKVDYIKFASSGWGHTPDPSTELFIDEMKLSNLRLAPRMAVEFPQGLQHPYLLVDRDEIAQIRERIQRHPWSKGAYLALKANAQEWAATTIQVPETGGGFYHDVDQTAYQVTKQHYALANAARDLALMYQLSGEDAYLEKARAILLAYADAYLGYPIHDKAGRTGEKASAGGRATAQAINEAAWIIPLAWAYDLIFHRLTPVQRSAIEERLLRPAAELIMRNNEGRHNHQAWYNAGVGMVGFALGEKEYIWYALFKDDSGFFYQMEQGVTEEGMWYEGSMHYQFYVLKALFPLAEAAYHADFNLYQTPGYKRLLDFPIRYATPDLRLPTINDGRAVYLAAPDRAGIYEVAYRRLADPLYAPVLRASTRMNLHALLYGVPELENPAPLPWQSLNLRDSNLAVLRSGNGMGLLQAVLNYMGYQGGHSHADQLSLVLWGLGRYVAPDPGSVRYRLPVHEEYFKQSVAHNLLVVDGRSQERAPAAQLEVFLSTPALQMVQASSQDIYPGVALTRTLLLMDGLLVDLFQARSDQPHTYDWIYHNQGRFVTEELAFQAGAEPLGTANGYQHLTDIRQAQGRGALQAEWILGGNRRVRLHFLGQEETDYFLATGPTATGVGDELASRRMSLVLARRQGPEVQFVTLIQPYQDQPRVEDVQPIPLTYQNGQRLTPSKAQAWRLEMAEGDGLLAVSSWPGLKQLGDYRLDGGLAWIQQGRNGKLAWIYTSGSYLETGGWSAQQKRLGTRRGLAGLGFYLAFGEEGQVYLQSSSASSTLFTFQGLFPQVAAIVKRDRQGNRIHNVQSLTNKDGQVRFLLDPYVLYEILPANSTNRPNNQ